MAKLSLRVNGSTREVEAADPDIPLLYALRDHLGLTGTHFGCGLAQCGACTVLVGGRAVRSCVTPARAVAGQDVTTIEGLGTPAKPDPLQAAFVAEQAAQCGFCSSGMLLTAAALLREKPEATRAEVRDYISGNYCRCTGYHAIVDAICDVLARRRAGAVRATA